MLQKHCPATHQSCGRRKCPCVWMVTWKFDQGRMLKVSVTFPPWITMIPPLQSYHLGKSQPASCETQPTWDSGGKTGDNTTVISKRPGRSCPKEWGAMSVVIVGHLGNVSSPRGASKHQHHSKRASHK